MYLVMLLLLAFVAIYEYSLLRRQKLLFEKIRKILYETSDKISKTDNEDEIYQITLEAIVCMIPNATKGSVLLVDDKGDFYYKVVNGFHKELENLTLKREEVYLYKINGFKETTIINNPSEYDRINTHKKTIESLKKINALDIYCTISAPIYIDNKLIGLINVDSDKTGNTFSMKDLYLMDQIKCELQIAIKNALAQNKLKYLASYDELTGIMNRRMLKQEFDNELERMQQNKQTLCFVMMDVDNFKLFNDSYGHTFGDIVLKHFSTILSKSISKTDIVARFSGDEFIVVFKDCNLATAERKMDFLTEAVSSTKLEDIFLEFSYGICEVTPSDNLNFDNALAIADVKMYEHKRQKVIKRKQRILCTIK